MEYNLDIHHHNFAAWAAARAAQRGLRGLTTSKVIIALKASGIKAVVDSQHKWPQAASAFDAVHKVWCTGILKSLQTYGIANVEFGRAAKIVAIY